MPVFWLEAPPPLRVSLTFRVGQSDEDLPWRGLTHLVEHLALSAFAHQNYHYNGFVDHARTTFHAEGTAEQVTGFLAGVTAALKSPPPERVPAERRILLSEEAAKPAGSWANHLSLRFGPNGPGLNDYAQYGLRWLGAEPVAQWSAQRFCVQNAAAWVSGPPPAGLRFELPAGARSRQPASPALDLTTPCHSIHDARGVGIAMVAPRTLALAVGARLLTRRAREALRWQQGVAYAPDCSYWPLDPDRAHLLLGSDALPDQVETIARGLLEVMAALRGEGPTSSELADDRAMLEAALGQPAWVYGRLERAVRQHLDLDPPDRVDVLEEHGELRPEDVARALEEAWGSALVLVPKQGREAVKHLPEYPAYSDESVIGRQAPRRLRSPGEAPADTRLTVGDQGLTLTFPGDRLVTVFFARVAAALWWHSGLRVLIGSDGFTVRVRASEWYGADQVLALIQQHVPPERLVPMDPPDADVARLTHSCEVCGGYPARTVRLYRTSWFPSFDGRLRARLCKDCGRSLARRWGDSTFRRSLAVVSWPTVLYGGFWDVLALLFLGRLPDPERDAGRDHWAAGQSLWRRPGVYVVLAIALLLALFGLAVAMAPALGS